jgi:hypothetical protein
MGLMMLSSLEPRNDLPLRVVEEEEDEARVDMEWGLEKEEEEEEEEEEEGLMCSW